MAQHITTPPSKAWAQVADEALQVTASSKRMKRVYKVPTKRLYNIVAGLKIGSTIGLVHGWLASIVNDVDQGITETEWALEGDESWIVEQYTVEQQEAGEYSLLKITYYVNPFNINDPESEQTYQMSEQVQLQMQSYSVSPYVYCNTQKQFKPTMLSAYNDQRTPVGLQTNRNHIESFLSQPIAQKGGNLYGYEWEIQRYAILTNGEAQIAEKVLNGANPVFHYPIVTRTVQLMSTKTQPTAEPAPALIDTIVVNPSGDAFEGWTGDWIYTGRDVQRRKVNIYSDPDPEQPKLSAYYELQFTDTWVGALSADHDFYDENDRWNFGEGPTQEKDFSQ